ncbi:hypothetical protein ISR1_1245 [Streptococcus pyogenes]|nr:hypothetical protein FE90_1258 [Streptococcus pyogenes]AMY98153.1 hypothetical protein AUQ45_1602 [Streptococcus pyogenes]BAU59664.1 hypothetial protein [Streptococcus pyogenes]SDV93208.1 hypothetical protein ISR1_1245 [Streptococcus pyogenes]
MTNLPKTTTNAVNIPVKLICRILLFCITLFYSVSIRL